MLPPSTPPPPPPPPPPHTHTHTQTMDQLYTNGDGGEEYFEASGSLEPLGDNDTTMLFRDLEHELQLLTQRYHVPPDDLSQLFQVREGGGCAKVWVTN